MDLQEVKLGMRGENRFLSTHIMSHWEQWESNRAEFLKTRENSLQQWKEAYISKMKREAIGNSTKEIGSSDNNENNGNNKNKDNSESDGNNNNNEMNRSDLIGEDNESNESNEAADHGIDNNNDVNNSISNENNNNENNENNENNINEHNEVTNRQKERRKDGKNSIWCKIYKKNDVSPRDYKDTFAMREHRKNGREDLLSCLDERSCKRKQTKQEEKKALKEASSRRQRRWQRRLLSLFCIILADDDDDDDDLRYIVRI